MQWTEFLLLPVAAEAAAREGEEGPAAALAQGLVAFLERAQRKDGPFARASAATPSSPATRPSRSGRSRRRSRPLRIGLPVPGRLARRIRAA